jgi:hypothetical protein
MAGRWLLLLALTALSAMPAMPAAAAAPTSEAAVKAEFLPRFARYVTWPGPATPANGQPFVLCILGDDPFRGLVDRAAREQIIDGRRIIVKRLGPASDVDSCQIAYIGHSGSRPAGQLIAAIGRKPVLTVTDAANDGQRGIIHFTVVSGRVRFFIDQAAAEARGLSISSRLLALAVGVRQ